MSSIRSAADRKHIHDAGGVGELVGILAGQVIFDFADHLKLFYHNVFSP